MGVKLENDLKKASSIGANIANMIIPGSGAAVGKVIEVGGKILGGLVDLFRKKKSEGMTDAQVMADREMMEAAREQESTLMLELKKEADSIQSIADQFTSDDKALSTQLKQLKMKGVTGNKAIEAAFKNPNFDPSGLSFFFEFQKAKEGTQEGQTGGTKDNTYNEVVGGTSVQEQSQESNDGKMSNLLEMGAYLLGIGYLGFQMFLSGLSSEDIKKKEARRKQLARARQAKKTQTEAQKAAARRAAAKRRAAKK